MPCPHHDIKIIQRSNHQSAVASAAYQSGERLFSEYDQKQKYYSHKSEIVHTEIMLPPHAPPAYADRNTLWNAAEAIEKQWNSQLARRIVLAIPREIPPEQHADLIRDYCREFFVSKGMIADFAIHDKGNGNPHAHILLTMRAMDENGKWLPKSRKVYDLDENGERIRLPSGSWKSHKEDMEAIRYLREKELSTVQSLDAYLDTVSGQAVSIRAEMKPKEQRMKEINTLLSHIANFEAHKPVHVEYAAIRFKKPREQFAAAHRDELDAYNAAIRYFKVHLKEKKYSIKKLNEEQTQLAGEVAGYKERLSALQEDVKILRDVRHWLNQVLPSEQYRQTAEPGKKPSIQQAVKGRTQRIREEQAEKRKQPRTEKKQDMEL